MTLKTWQLQLLESIDGWEKFCLTQSDQNKQQLLEMARNGEPKPKKKTKLGSVFRNYIRLKGGCYDDVFDAEIRELRPDWFDNSVQKKQRLLEMARKEHPIPKVRTHNLGIFLRIYTNPKNPCYDSNFSTEIRNLRPDWFISQFDVASDKKQQLLEMAKNGEPRPNDKKHELGIAFNHYMRSDPEFNAEIRRLRPDWFISTSNIAKQQLLEMARNGEPRPNDKKHELGSTLSSYTNPKNGCYNPEFDKEVRELRPDWFISQFDVASEKKQQLLEMARNCEPKPKRKTKLGSVFNNYICTVSKCYDPKFAAEIRNLRPDWFISTSNIAKQQLLEMAKNGEPRPNNKKHELGGMLSSYTSLKNGCYNPEFDKEIRNLRPDWFVLTSDIADQKKQQLLDMAKNGELRPSQKTGELGKVLTHYTNQGGSYDPDFDKEIRKLRSDWFRS